MWSIKAWRRRRLLERHQIDRVAWERIAAGLPLLDGLSVEDLARLRDLAALFLHEKEIDGAGGVILTDSTRLLIAAQACLPILNLGIDYYEGWVSVIVYPDEFVPEHEYTDEAGVVHTTRHPMIGEAWLRGPMILSAADAERSGTLDGVNVVIHECAHKLDMLNGEPNGFPPLHSGMSAKIWSDVFTRAYADFCSQVEAGSDTAIDPYAADAPGEFFAVMSEAFFEIPQVLAPEYPDVYVQLASFYRQDPWKRFRS